MVLETLSLSCRAQVATLSLNRPESRNALNAKMCQELIEVAALVSQDPNIRVLLIRGAGAIFCAGGDLKERKGMSNDQVMVRRDLAFDAYLALERITKPVISVIHGAAYGSGLEIAAASDFVIAAQGSKFCYPEVGWGSIGATQRLPRIVGPRIAKELLFTSRVFLADEARAIGLVNHVFALDELEEKLAEIANKIAAAAPLAVCLTKRSINEGLGKTPEQARFIELQAIKENLEGSDWQAATASFGQR
jgi:enoyl-CoA hydratase